MDTFGGVIQMTLLYRATVGGDGWKRNTVFFYHNRCVQRRHRVQSTGLWQMAPSCDITLFLLSADTWISQVVDYSELFNSRQ